jgi:putative ABC transport system substrate-binding protein
VKLAADLRLPTIYAFKEDVEAGGLMSYGASILDMQAQAVTYIDKILRGSLPSGLPVQEPAKFDLAINARAAKALNVTIPPSLMLRADRIVE